MNYKLFLDETGDHGLSFIDENFPIFLLCGCIITEEELHLMESRINDLKKDIFGSTEVILHSRDIRKCEGAFQKLFDIDTKAKFYTEINKILAETNYKLIGAGVNKKEHIKKYGKNAGNPYSLSLSFVLERLIFFLDSMESNAKADILVEKRGKKEDQQLLAHFNSIKDIGTYYVSPSRFNDKIGHFGFHSKRENIIGLQIADLCAYPMARYILNPKEPYVPFEVIENHIYQGKQGKYMGWGLKVFP
jgi:hypothetical protein